MVAGRHDSGGDPATLGTRSRARASWNAVDHADGDVEAREVAGHELVEGPPRRANEAPRHTAERPVAPVRASSSLPRAPDVGVTAVGDHREYPLEQHLVDQVVRGEGRPGVEVDLGALGCPPAERERLAPRLRGHAGWIVGRAIRGEEWSGRDQE